MSLFSGENPQLGSNATAGGYKIQNVFHAVVNLSASSTAQTVFIAPTGYKIVSIQELHAVVGGSGATVTLEKCTGTQAPGAGVAMLSTPVTLTSTANTVKSTTLSTTTANTVLATGDRINTVLAGTLTGLAGCTLQILLARL